MNNITWFVFHFSMMWLIGLVPVAGFLKPDYLVVSIGFLGWLLEAVYWFRVARLKKDEK